jgi:DNA-binding transcriptional ArsR family regulator
MESNNETLLKTLTVETLHVYNYLLKRYPNDVGLAELSNHLGSTKPTVLHHLEKLKRVDLIEQTERGYRVKEMVKINVIKGYSNIVRQTLKEWLPITMLCIVWLFTSIMTAIPYEAKVVFIIMSLGGVAYSLEKIWKSMST